MRDSKSPVPKLVTFNDYILRSNLPPFDTDHDRGAGAIMHRGRRKSDGTLRCKHTSAVMAAVS